MGSRADGSSVLLRAHNLLENEYKWEFMDMKAMFGKSTVRPASVATTRTWKAKPAPKVTVNTRRCHHSSKDVVQAIVNRLGWVECNDEQACSLLWTGSHCEPEFYANMMCFQKVNRFPGMAEMTSKVNISKSLRRIKSLYPEEYSFFPDTWILSEDFPRSYRNKTQNGGISNGGDISFPVTEFPSSSTLEAPQCSYHEKSCFILKPDNGAQGDGIVMAESIADFDLNSLTQVITDDMIIQRYIEKPLLIDGFKFDMRIYVLITNMEDLQLFRYEEGLARLCTQKYESPNPRNFDKQYMHLTNYSLNKQNEDYTYNESSRRGDEGSKRTLSSVNKYLKEKGYDVEEVWADIDDMIAKTALAMQPQAWHNYRSNFGEDNDGKSCFQILGFDVLLDQYGKPWLLEVNHSPSFCCDTPLDTMVKEAVIMDTLKLINFNIMSKPKRARRRPQSRARSGSTKSVVAEEWGFHQARSMMSEKQKQEDRMDRLRRGAQNAQPQHEEGSESSRLGGWIRVNVPKRLKGLHSEALRASFKSYAGPRLGDLSNARFYRFLRDYGMLENCRLTRAEIDLIFSDAIKVKKDALAGIQPKYGSTAQVRGIMSYPLFVDALARFSAKRWRKGTYSESFNVMLSRFVEPQRKLIESGECIDSEHEGSAPVTGRDRTQSLNGRMGRTSLAVPNRSVLPSGRELGELGTFRKDARKPNPAALPRSGRLKSLDQRRGTSDRASLSTRVAVKV